MKQEQNQMKSTNFPNEYQRNSRLLDKKYKEFFIPTVLTAMATSMSIVVDGIIVGNMLNANALAAVNLVSPIMMLYTTIAVFLGMGAAAALSIAKGRRQNEYADDIFTTSMFIMTILSVILTVLQLCFLDEICRILVKKEELIPLVKSYLQVLVLGTPLLVLIPGVVYCLRTDGKAKLASMVLISANVINLTLDMVYMGPLGMGIEGSSLATVSGYSIGFIVLLSYIFSKDRTLHFRFGIITKPIIMIKYAARIMTLGIPGGLSSILMTFKILCINTIVLAVEGSSGMIAFSVCVSCLSLISMFISGAAQTMMPLIGTLYGEKDYRGMEFVIKKAFTVLMIASTVMFLILEATPKTVLSMFGVTDIADIVIGVQAIRIFAISLIGTSVNYLLLYYYMTTEKKKIAGAISVVQGFAIVVPSAFLLSKLIGIAGVWLSFSIAELMTILMIVIYYLIVKKEDNGRYKNILLMEEESDYKVLDFTIESTIDNGVEVSKKVIQFLRENGIPPKLYNKVGLAIEEMTVNIAKYGYKNTKNHYVDLRIKIFETEIVVVIRDDGDFFNPTIYFAEESEEYLVGGIAIIRAIAEKMEYARILGMNNTTICIKGGEL